MWKKRNIRNPGPPATKKPQLRANLGRLRMCNPNPCPPHRATSSRVQTSRGEDIGAPDNGLTVSTPSRAIARAPALGDQGSSVRSFDRSNPGEGERARLAATLGARLRSMRAERGLSTRALAVRSTVARSTITRLERGERRPRPGILAALAYGLDHENPGPLAEALQEATGPSLQPDTPQGVRRRARRLGRAQCEVHALRVALNREAGRARVASRSLTFAALRAAPMPPTGNLTTGRLVVQLDRADACLAESERLDRRADDLMRTLAWPYHPLWKEPLERRLDT
jgi:transcriptional regulator with XRE-family HTH domain